MCAQFRQRGREIAPILLDAGLTRIALVPAPSRRRRKKDGLFVVGKFASALCDGLRDGGIGASVADVLTIDEKVVERRAKASAVACVAPIGRNVPVGLVDDVLVTGSTLAGCARAIEKSGGRVCCVFVVAQQEKMSEKIEKTR